MVENDWIRPTPDGEHDLMLLSNAEALAFARQLPEVEALVETARNQAQTLLNLSNGFVSAETCEIARNGALALFAALDPFRESPDA